MSKVVRNLVIAILIITMALGSMAMVPAEQTGQQSSQKYFVVQFAGPIQES